jgi:hypothetical protein
MYSLQKWKKISESLPDGAASLTVLIDNDVH